MQPAEEFEPDQPVILAIREGDHYAFDELGPRCGSGLESFGIHNVGDRGFIGSPETRRSTPVEMPDVDAGIRRNSR